MFMKLILSKTNIGPPNAKGCIERLYLVIYVAK